MAKQRITRIAPARVNLIGEHTDYTGGLVLPMAIPFFTEVTLSPAEDGLYRFQSANFPEERVLSPSDRSDGKGDWSDYPVGVLREFQKLGHEPEPFSMHVEGNVPLGSGLSSSASIEVATAFALLAHLGVNLPPEEIALLCQRAENLYVHSPCGIMDQTVIVLAEEGHALLLDTGTMQHTAVPMNRGGLTEISIVVCNSMVKHSIAGGEYGQRRRQVEEGQTALCAANPGVKDLGHATLEQLQGVRENISLEAFKRCRHIISENGRVRLMQAALEAGDAATCGQLMVTAHASERDDFECSVPEVDFLVDTAVHLPGCYGGRLTGGGFGGCTVNLVNTAEVESFTAELAAAYRGQYGITPELFVCEPVDGALARSKKNGPQGGGKR